MSSNWECGQNDSGADVFASPNIKGQSVSPNISSSSSKDDISEREKVDIDSVPIAEDEIKFRSTNIKQKDDSDLFVNIEGAKNAQEKQNARRN
ncbi:MAG: hypothetical protein K6F57_00560 [Candidatus Saccharibacteria bacterium]|nr:hypothetical protein [Candidatus Saccharibacteria bacterium]